jgi:hypothetical protein
MSRSKSDALRQDLERYRRLLRSVLDVHAIRILEQLIAEKETELRKLEGK